jgi:hypothetical protein
VAVIGPEQKNNRTSQSVTYAFSAQSPTTLTSTTTGTFFKYNCPASTIESFNISCAFSTSFIGASRIISS